MSKLGSGYWKDDCNENNKLTTIGMRTNNRSVVQDLPLRVHAVGDRNGSGMGAVADLHVGRSDGAFGGVYRKHLTNLKFLVLITADSRT